MEEIKFVIANNIAELRKAHKLTQLELAEKLNYSDKAISKWERGDAIPDVTVLKEIADLFGVTLDYLVSSDHEETEIPRQSVRKIRNRGLITGMSILLVWFVATFCFSTVDFADRSISLHWLSFVWAVPVSMIVWLIFNTLWFNKKRNFLIISLLVWTAVAALFFTLLPFGLYFWQSFILGIPAQIIILMWSGLRIKRKKKPKKEKLKKEKKKDIKE